MWIESLAARRALQRATCLLLLTMLPLALQAEEGQYRSKIRIDPDADLNQDIGLTAEELERQIDSITDPYARSSAGRHLARHFVEQGEYGKAIDYYRTALTAAGLSDVANREMLRELAQVYLLSGDFVTAAATLEQALRIRLQPDTVDYLLLAQAYYRSGKLVQVVDALDRIQAQGLNLSLDQQRQALALYYQAGAYAQAERLLRQLLEAEPDNADTWHQLVAVLLQQGKRKQALDQLSLAREKAVPFDERDFLLLADLRAVNGNPYGAAELLDAALTDKRIEPSGAHYRKLFQFWLQAREQERATAALVQAAQRSGDIDLYLYLAQLQMEQEAWQPMYQTMLAACRKPLPDRYVGRANLLLGISQLKLGDGGSARRSFINATLIGGAGAQAGQWLEFMEAAPPSDREARAIVGICHGSGDTAVAADAFRESAGKSAAIAEAAPPEAAAVDTKTVPGMKFFYLEYREPLASLAEEARSLALPMGIALVKSGGTVNGPLQVIAPASDHEAALQLGFPVRGSPRAGGRYRLRVTPNFKCAYLVSDAGSGPLADIWSAFLVRVEEAGYALTDERRVLLQVGNGGDGAKIELQVGIH